MNRLRPPTARVLPSHCYSPFPMGRKREKLHLRGADFPASIAMMPASNREIEKAKKKRAYESPIPPNLWGFYARSGVKRGLAQVE
jgi:hypothetical protein